MVKVFTYIKNDSTRVHRKNFINLGGLPLWKHLIYRLSKSYDVFIDTDSEEVIKDCNEDQNLQKVVAYTRKKEFIDMDRDWETS